MTENQHPYQIEIPNGYQYCPDCELLTPHTLNPQINPSKAYPEDFTCDVCGLKKDGVSLCPMCGWEHDPDNDIAPLTIKVRKHIRTCLHVDDDNCDCPEVDCYPIQHVFNYSEWTPSYLDCWNAKEWSYDIMCKICNYVFEVQDGNC